MDWLFSSILYIVTTMTKETAQFLINVTEHCGNQEANLRENYSGRCMYGRDTCAIVVDNQMQLMSDLIQYMADNVMGPDDDEKPQGDESWNWEGGPIPDIDSLRIDSMGRGVVIY